ncbi:MAG: carboxylating nicotinate-nucleotide diphosphorylase [Gemmatimonadaceae bacterium]|nr:carboxylating nicotinate-nucleotide diphosphorylase [Gemmatimonadaceae bacterium]
MSTASASIDVHGFPLREIPLRTVVREALFEDRAFEDVTTLATISVTSMSSAVLAARKPGVVCGGPLAIEAFQQVSPHVRVETVRPDGSVVDCGDAVLRITGPSRALLQAERVALNYMMHLSGIATMTHTFVRAISGTTARILDTRKTTPGLRQLEKYAVRCGGGRNHRMDLASMAMLKDNHLAVVGGDIVAAVAAVRAILPAGTWVEVEADRRAQVERAIESGADVIMLDNMELDTMRECVTLVAGRAIVEASGGVTLDRVRAIAETGVDWISVGALTHSAPALDLGLDFS